MARPLRIILVGGRMVSCHEPGRCASRCGTGGATFCKVANDVWGFYSYDLRAHGQPQPLLPPGQARGDPIVFFGSMTGKSP
jgi:hypothetical protein